MHSDSRGRDLDTTDRARARPQWRAWSAGLANRQGATATAIASPSMLTVALPGTEAGYSPGEVRPRTGRVAIVRRGRALAAMPPRGGARAALHGGLHRRPRACTGIGAVAACGWALSGQTRKAQPASMPPRQARPAAPGSSIGGAPDASSEYAGVHAGISVMASCSPQIPARLARLQRVAGNPLIAGKGPVDSGPAPWAECGKYPEVGSNTSWAQERRFGRCAIENRGSSWH